jgi:hypothetical protein
MFVCKNVSQRPDRRALLTILPSHLPAPFDALLRLSSPRTVLWLHLLFSGVAYSQRSSSTFGPTTDISLGYTPSRLAASPRTPVVAVLSQESPTISYYQITALGGVAQANGITLPKNGRDIAFPTAARWVDGECAVLSNDGLTAYVVSPTGMDSSIIPFDLPYPSQRIVYADINNDRRDDVLAFGMRRTGISTIVRDKEGGFTPGAVLMPDVSMSDAKAVDLNGDGITDLFVLNWLSNHLALYYGIGRGVFSEQIEVALPGEPDELALSPLTEDRTLQIAVTIPDANTVSTFLCNSSGEIEQLTDLKLPDPPLHAQFADINGDKENDLIVTTEFGVFVYLGKPVFQFAQPVVFGVGGGLIESEIFDADGDGKLDLAVIDRSSKRLIVLGNADWTGSVSWPPVYAVGGMPRAIGVMDLNNDGLPDIAVANSGSSTISLLFNRGDGRLASQQTFVTSEKPVAIKPLDTGRGNDPVILASHASSDKISIVRVAGNGGRSSVSAVPTGSNPYIVLGKVDSLSGHVEMLVRNSAQGNGSYSLSLFQQISGGQLVEKSLRSSIPARISGLTVGDYSGRGLYDLLFVTQDKGARQASVSIALPTTEFDFKTIRHVVSFADSATGSHALIPAFVDEDQFKDLVIVLPSPRNALGILYGRGDGQFRDSLEVLRNVQPLNEDAVIVRDVNADGHPDITWIDVARNAVMTSYGRGNHRFDQPVSLCPATKVAAIQIAALRKAGDYDLILANGMRGTITLLFDPFAR